MIKLILCTVPRFGLKWDHTSLELSTDNHFQVVSSVCSCRLDLKPNSFQDKNPCMNGLGWKSQAVTLYGTSWLQEPPLGQKLDNHTDTRRLSNYRISRLGDAHRLFVCAPQHRSNTESHGMQKKLCNPLSLDPEIKNYNHVTKFQATN